MAEQATQQITVEATPERCFEVVTDFERYPEWAPDVKEAKVVERDAEGRPLEVEFRAAAMGRSTRYQLRYDLSGAPSHLSWSLTHGDITYDEAIRVNAEATGLLMQHCRKAKAILVMSTHSVYMPQDDPLHVFLETDPIGDCHAQSTPTYSVSKISQEAVARTCARAFDVPTIICRMNAAYTPWAGLPAMHAAAVVEGRTVVTRWDPCPYSLIHQDDINRQTEALLDAAAVPAPIVNWAGDDWASVQEYCAFVGELVGREAKVEVQYPPNTLRGSIASNERRIALTGPCEVPWREGMRRNVAERWPDLVGAAG